MSICTPANCTDFLNGNFSVEPNLVANPDIAGVGVLIGFVSTAYTTLLLLIVYYLLGFNPNKSEPSARTNPIDRALLNWLWRKTELRPLDKWGVALEKCVLILSDQQIVTGAAILASGYSQLHCGLAVFYWQLVVYLAWFSSLTHLTTLTILRHYLRQHPAIRLRRICLMVVVILMLGVALLPTGSVLWMNSIKFGFGGTQDDYITVAGYPALCYFQQLRSRGFSGADQFPTMMVSLFFLFTSYIGRGVKLFEKSSAFARKILRSIPGDVLKRHLDTVEVLQKGSRVKVFPFPYYRVVLSLLVILRASFDLFESMIWEILWLVFALVWGSVRLFLTRSTAPDWAAITNRRSGGDGNGISIENNSWGFGQWLSTLLLVLPVLTMAETIYETTRDIEEPSPKPIASLNTQEGKADHGSSMHHTTEALVPIASTDIQPNAEPESEFCLPPRTGTDLSNLERTITSGDSTQRQLQQIPRTQDSTSLCQITPEASYQKSKSKVYDKDYYQYNWYWGLLALMLILIHEVIIWVVIQLTWYGSATLSLSLLFKSLIYWCTVAAPLSLILYTSICMSIQDNPAIVLWLSGKFGRASQAKAQKLILWVSCCTLLSVLAIETIWSMLGFLYVVDVAADPWANPVWGQTDVEGPF